MAVPLGLDGLPAYAERLLKAYESKSYKTNFEWVDNICAVRDAVEIKNLNETVIAALNARDLAKMYLAPPEMLSSDTFPDFRYPGERADADAHTDLDLEECLAALAARERVDLKDLKLTVDQAKAAKIRVALPEHDGDFEKWSLFDCLAFEFETADALFVLSAGDWFRVEKTYAANIKKKLQKFVKVGVLPDAERDEAEDKYNARVAPLINAVLLDRKILKADEAKTGIESCDLFLKDGQFVHVKRKTRSSTLSHLFAQGLVSSEVFLRDEKFRSELRKLVEAASPAVATLLPAPSETPQAAKYGVVYAIVARAKGGIAKTLPFFSQVNFVRMTDRLATLGFRITLTLVTEK